MQLPTCDATSMRLAMEPSDGESVRLNTKATAQMPTQEQRPYFDSRAAFYDAVSVRGNSEGPCCAGAITYVQLGLRQLHASFSRMMLLLESSDEDVFSLACFHLLYKHMDVLMDHCVTTGGRLRVGRIPSCDYGPDADAAWIGIGTLAPQLRRMWNDFRKEVDRGEVPHVTMPLMVALEETCRQISLNAKIPGCLVADDLVVNHLNEEGWREQCFPVCLASAAQRPAAVFAIFLSAFAVCLCVAWGSYVVALPCTVPAVACTVSCVVGSCLSAALIVDLRALHAVAGALVTWIRAPNLNYNLNSIVRDTQRRRSTSRRALSQTLTLLEGPLVNQSVEFSWNQSDGKIQHWGPSVAALTEFSEKEVVGRHINCLLDPQSHGNQPIRGETVVGGVLVGRRIVLLRKVGKPLHLLATIGAIDNRVAVSGVVDTNDVMQVMAYFGVLTRHVLLAYPSEVAAIATFVAIVPQLIDRAVTSWAQVDICEFVGRVFANVSADAAVQEQLVYLDVDNLQDCLLVLGEVASKVVVDLHDDNDVELLTYARLVFHVATDVRLPDIKRRVEAHGLLLGDDVPLPEGAVGTCCPAGCVRLMLVVPTQRTPFSTSSRQLPLSKKQHDQNECSRRAEGATIHIFEPNPISECQLRAIFSFAARYVNVQFHQSRAKLKEAVIGAGRVDGILMSRSDWNAMDQLPKALSRVVRFETVPDNAPPGEGIFASAGKKLVKLPVSINGLDGVLIELEKKIKIDQQTQSNSDEYELEKPLGKGSTGQVFSAVSRLSYARVAIKVVSSTKDARAAHECAILKRVKEIGLETANQREGGSKFIVSLIAIQADEKQMRLILELCDTTLSKMNEPASLPLSHTSLHQYASECLMAIDFLHRNGIAHRDIKSANILLKDAHVRLSDFGSAIDLHTAAGPPSKVGATLSHLPPEADATTRVPPAMLPTYYRAGDVWAFGIVVLEMLRIVPEILRDGSRSASSAAQQRRAYFEQGHFEEWIRSRHLSKDIEAFLLQVFNLNYEQRPKANELLNVLWSKDTPLFVEPTGGPSIRPDDDDGSGPYVSPPWAADTFSANGS